MKTKIILTLLTCFLLVDLISAQVRFGGTIGGSMTNITKVHSYSKSRGGLQIGALAQIPISHNDIFFFQPEVFYSMQGEYDQPRKEEGIADKQSIFFSFINIPLNAKVYMSDAYSDFFVIGGPYIGFKVGEKIDKLPYTTEADIYKFKSMDFGFNLGVGYSIERNFEFTLRYLYGFSDQVENDAANTSNHNSNLSLGLSYIFQ